MKADLHIGKMDVLIYLHRELNLGRAFNAVGCRASSGSSELRDILIL